MLHATEQYDINRIYVPNDVVTYICDPGYSFNQGATSLNITCEVIGTEREWVFDSNNGCTGKHCL